MAKPKDELLSAEDQIRKVLVEEKRREQGETLSVLDSLRRSRKARGGVGAPLEVPAHLKDAAAGKGIIITDEDLKNDTPIRPGTFGRKGNEE